MNQRPPEKLPDPWLFDSEALLRELDRCRELVLEIPITNPNATHFGINVAVTAIWNLREKLRYLLALHREAQRAFAKKAQPVTQPKPSQEVRESSARENSSIQDIVALQATPRTASLRSAVAWSPPVPAYASTGSGYLRQTLGGLDVVRRAPSHPCARTRHANTRNVYYPFCYPLL